MSHLYNKSVAKIQQHLFNPSCNVPHNWIPSLLKLAYPKGEGIMAPYLLEIQNGIQHGGLMAVARYDNNFIGLGMLTFGSWFVDDVDYTGNVFVDSRYRRKGIGRMLFNMLLANSRGSVVIFPSRESGGENGFFSKVNTSRLRTL